MSILIFLGLSVLDLGLVYATDRQTSDRHASDAHHRLMPPTLGAGHNNWYICKAQFKQSSNAPLLHYRAGVESFELPRECLDG